MATTKQKQDIFLGILEKTGALNIGLACQKMGISRQTYYRWLKQKRFSQRYNDLLESLKDVAESKLMELVEQGKFSAVRYYLERQGKSRGYGRADAHRPLSDPGKAVMQKFRDGEIDAIEAGIEFALLGEPLPQVLLLQLQRTPAPEAVVDDDGVSYEELDKMYAEYKEESADEQVWLKQRRADVAADKAAFEAGNLGFSKNKTDKNEG